MRLFIALLVVVLASCAPIENATIIAEDQSFELERIASGLEHPWGLAFLPDDRILVTERPGRMRIIEDGTVSQPLEGLPGVAASGQGGLLDVALHPDFDENRYVYFTYSATIEGGTMTRLTRARFENDRFDNVEVLFTGRPGTGSTNHYGSRIAFSDEHIYISIGDRGRMESAQDLASHAGTIIRLNHDGTVPTDNPFVDNPDALDEIYAYGVRNPQGLIWRSDRGELWSHEHGPQGGDEVNVIRAGRNYGWPLFTYGERYGGGAIGSSERPDGIEPSIHHWTPSIAPSGMAHYTIDVLSAWTGDIFVGALAGQRLVRLTFDGTELTGEEHLLEGEIGRIRDVRTGPDGYLYILTDARNGSLYRITP